MPPSPTVFELTNPERFDLGTSVRTSGVFNTRTPRIAKQKSNKAWSKLHPPANGYLREIFTPQNIHPIPPTPKFTLGIIEIIVKIISTIFQY